MPTYEYKCNSCSHVFEAFQSIKDDPLDTCPLCGKKVRRLINGGTGIIFKGSGFYVTDKGRGSSSAMLGKSDKSGDTASDNSSSVSPAVSTETASQKEPPAEKSKPAAEPAARKSSA